MKKLITIICLLISSFLLAQQKSITDGICKIDTNYVSLSLSSNSFSIFNTSNKFSWKIEYDKLNHVKTYELFAPDIDTSVFIYKDTIQKKCFVSYYDSTNIKKIQYQYFEYMDIDTIMIVNPDNGECEMILIAGISEVKSGDYYEFYTNGTIKVEGEYLNVPHAGKLKTGRWKYWDSDGKWTKQEVYEIISGKSTLVNTIYKNKNH